MRKLDIDGTVRNLALHCPDLEEMGVDHAAKLVANRRAVISALTSIDATKLKPDHRAP